MDKKAENALMKAAINLLERSCASAFCGPIQDTTPQRYVAVGEANEIENLLRISTGAPKKVDARNVYFDDLVLDEVRNAESNDEIRKILDAHIAVCTRR